MPIIASIASHAADAGRATQMHAPDGFLSLPVALAHVGGLDRRAGRRRPRDQPDARRTRHPAHGRHGRLHLRRPDVQLPGRRRDVAATCSAACWPRSCSGRGPATLVMACVIAVQALVFQDGGLVVMGANIFNMGVVGTLGGYALYRGLCTVLGGEARARIPAAGIAAWALGRGRVGLHGARAGHLRDDHARDRPADDARHPRPHRHRRGPHHHGRARLHRRDPAGPASSCATPGRPRAAGSRTTAAGGRLDGHAQALLVGRPDSRSRRLVVDHPRAAGVARPGRPRVGRRSSTGFLGDGA